MPTRPAAAQRQELAEAIIVAVIFAMFARTFLFQAFVVPTSSMEPAVLVGDHLLINKFAYAPHGRGLSPLLPYREVRRGDVVVFMFPGNPSTDFIKRIVALPGDRVETRGEGLLVNGSPQPSAPRPPGEREPAGSRSQARVGPLYVPFGEYFVVGDNRRASYDSRSWGPVPAGNLKGRALLIYWSFEGTTPLASNPREWLRRTRWSRTFRLVR